MATVLIAEDETIIRLDIRGTLEAAGYDVCAEARHGVEAVELARTLEPDIAVLDVKMPKLDGIEAARQILEQRSLPILLLTAFSDEKLVRRATECVVQTVAADPRYRRTKDLGDLVIDALPPCMTSVRAMIVQKPDTGHIFTANCGADSLCCLPGDPVCGVVCAGLRSIGEPSHDANMQTL